MEEFIKRFNEVVSSLYIIPPPAARLIHFIEA